MNLLYQRPILTFSIIFSFAYPGLVNAKNNSHFSTRKKEFVFKKVCDTLSKQAFAFDANFHLAGSKLAPYKSTLMKTRTKIDFMIEFSSILQKEFKVTHLSLCHAEPSDYVQSKSYKVAKKDQPRASKNFQKHQSLTWLNSMGKKVPVLKLNSFSIGEYSKSALDGYFKQIGESNAMILDLRDNDGGYIGNLLHFCSYFIESEKTIGYEVNSPMYERYLTTKGKKPESHKDLIDFLLTNKTFTKGNSINLLWKVPEGAPKFKGRVSILVSDFTASCAEICAQVLKNFCGSKIFGTPTRKCVLPAYAVHMAYNISLQYPVSEFISTDFQRIEGTGVRPDVICKKEEALKSSLLHVAKNV